MPSSRRSKAKSILQRLLRRVPLPVLSVIIGLGVGLLVWDFLDRTQREEFPRNRVQASLILGSFGARVQRPARRRQLGLEVPGGIRDKRDRKDENDLGQQCMIQIDHQEANIKHRTSLDLPRTDLPRRVTSLRVATTSPPHPLLYVLNRPEVASRVNR